MTIKKKTLYFLITILFTQIGYAKSISNTELISVISEQRGLTQKFLKNYSMIGMNLGFRNPKESLEKEIKIFDENLIILSKSNKNNKIKKMLRKINTIWKDEKKVLIKSVSKNKIKQLFAQNNKLLKEFNSVMKELNKISIINISSKQEMLSQKIMALYVINGSKGLNFKVKKELNKTLKVFKKALTSLKKSSLNSATTRKKLLRVSRYFAFIKMQISLKSVGFTPSLVHRKTDIILELMKSITAEYIQTTKGKK